MDRYEVHVPCGKEVVVICTKEETTVKLINNGTTLYESNTNASRKKQENNAKNSIVAPDDEDTDEEKSTDMTDTMAGGKRSRRNAQRKTNATRRKNQTGGKRGPNSYMKFANKIRPQVLKEHPELKSDVVGVARKIGEKWRALSDAEKKKY